MDIVIRGRNVDISPRLQSYVERKVERLDRFMPNIITVHVDLATENHRAGKRDVAQITLRNARGTILRAEERTDDHFVAVDAVVDKIFRQIERYKGKRKRRNGASEDFTGYETAIDLPSESFDSPAVIRRKTFSMIPMHEEEAIEQMELLGHDFFVFVNAESGGVNVVYVRHDGNFGLLEPEVE